MKKAFYLFIIILNVSLGNLSAIQRYTLDAYWGGSLIDEDCDSYFNSQVSDLYLGVGVIANESGVFTVHVTVRFLKADQSIAGEVVQTDVINTKYAAGSNFIFPLYTLPFNLYKDIYYTNILMYDESNPLQIYLLNFANDTDLNSKRFETREEDYDRSYPHIDAITWSDENDPDVDGYVMNKRLNAIISATGDLSCAPYSVYLTTLLVKEAANLKQGGLLGILTPATPSLNWNFLVGPRPPDYIKNDLIEFGEYDIEMDVRMVPTYRSTWWNWFNHPEAMSKHKFETEDQNHATIECTKIEWADPPASVDQDGDGYRSQDMLYLETHSWSDCYYKIYYKLSHKNDYVLYKTTDPHVLDPFYEFTVKLGNTELPHGTYDLKLELYNTNTDYLVATYDEKTDPTLNDQKFEKETEDHSASPDGSANVWVLIDGDPDFTKSPFADSLMAFTSSGDKLMALEGFNICRTIGGPRSLAVADDGQSCWVCESVGDKLSKIDMAGKIIMSIPRKIAAVDLDKNGHLYSLTRTSTIYGDSILVLDAQGNFLKGAHYGGYDLVVDDAHSAVWLVGGGIINLDLNLQHQVTVDPIAWTATTVDYASDGTIWVGEGKHPDVPESKDRLLHLDQSGLILHTLDLLYRPKCLRVDRSNNSIWILSDALYRYVPGQSQLNKVDAIAGYTLSIDLYDNLVWAATALDVRSYSQTGSLKTIITGFSQNTQKFIATRKQHSSSLYILNVTQSGPGTGWIKVHNRLQKLPYTERLPIGTVLSLEAVPVSYSIFSGWSGASSSTNPIINLTMDSDKDLNAIFDLAPSYPNMVRNPEFSNGVNDWYFFVLSPAVANGLTKDGEFVVQYINGGSLMWHVQLIQWGLSLEYGKTYHVLYDAYAAATKIINGWAGKDGDPWTSYSGTHLDTISTVKTRYDYSFTMNNPTDTKARIIFDIGLTTPELHFDNLALVEETNPVRVEPIAQNAPQDVSLNNYPNPFNNKTIIGYELPYACKVNLAVFDLVGQQVKILLTGTESAGPHTVSLTAMDLPSGVYFYRLTATSTDGKSYQLTKKLMLMK